MSPPFQYQPLQQPFAGSLADLMLRRGDIAAQGAQRIGAIGAQEAQQKGQAWAGATQAIGQDVAGALKTASDPQRIAAQRANASVPAVSDAITKTPMISENGTQVYDVPTIAKTIASQGFGPEALATAGHLSGLNDQIRQAAMARMAVVQRGATSLAQAGAGGADISDLATHFIDSTLVGNGFIPKEQGEQFKAEIAKDPAAALKLATYFAGPQAPLKLGEGERAVNPLSQATIAEGAPKPVVAPEGATVFNQQGGVIGQGAPKPVVAPAGSTVLTSGSAGLQPVLTTPAATEWGNFKEAFAKTQGAASWEALSPEQQQAGVERFKLIGPESAQAAATERQTRTIGAQIAQQQRGQDFQVQQAGRKELTDKVEQPYQTALASAQTLRDAVAAARSGNKTAAALQSLETTMAAIRAQGLNRINTAEIGVTANAGSIWDRIQGKVGKIVTGEPVSPAIQKDMEDFAGILEKAARRKYETGWQSITKRYGLNDEQMLPALPAAGTSTSSGLDPSIDALLKR